MSETTTHASQSHASKAAGKNTPKPDADATAKPEGANKPGRKPGQEVKQYDFSGLALDFLSKPQASNQQLDSLTAPMRARSEQQAAIDAVVARLHDDWETGTLRNDDGTVRGTTEPKAGKWARMPKGRYHVAPEMAEALKVLIRRGATFHGYGVKWGNPVRDTEGREIVVFAIRDVMKGKGTTDATDATDDDENDDETPEETTATEAEAAEDEAVKTA